MKRICLIRHAESVTNAGLVLTSHSHIIRITDKGKEQANLLCEIVEEPKRIIVSKFIRTIETAEPVIIKYPSSEVHLWLDTHEFDSVDHEKIKDITTREEFSKANEDYWAKKDPNYKDFEHNETFSEFIDRVHKVYLKLKDIPGGLNYIFTHGWFIKLFLLMGREFSNFEQIKNEKDIYQKIMDQFIEMDKVFKTENTGLYDVTELVENYNSNMV